MDVPEISGECKQVLPAGRLLLTLDFLIAEADSNFCHLFCFMPHALVGIRFESILTRSSQILFQLHFSPNLRLNGRVGRLHLALKAGNAKDVNIVVEASAASDGHPAGYVLLVSPDR